MKREIITYNVIEGIHNYPNAPEVVDFLSYPHRHNFVIRCKAEVSHNNREIEIILLQRKIERKLKQNFGSFCIFKSMSCEDIAEWLLNEFVELNYVEVLEDGYGGAALTR